MNTTVDPDVLAENLMQWGAMARKMPRSFDSDGITHAVGGPDGSLGRMLPGRGFMPMVDLERLGITRMPPNVYDPSIYRKLEDKIRARLIETGFDPTMRLVQGGAISTYDGIISSRANGKANDIAVFKSSITTVANVWSSLWRAGGQPGAGTFLATTAPTDRILDKTVVGALSAFLSNPAGSDKKYLLTFGYGSSQQINMAVLVDILNDSGTYRATVNTAEAVASPTNTTRQYGSGGGVGNLMTLICSTAGSPGAGTLIVHYIDQGGVDTAAPTLTVAAVAMIVEQIISSQTTVVTAGGGTFFIPLDPADTGVQAIKSVTFSVAGTGQVAGNVFFPLMFIPGIAASAYIERDSAIQIDGLSELVNASGVLGHLGLYVMPNTTSSGGLTGFMRTVSG